MTWREVLTRWENSRPFRLYNQTGIMNNPWPERLLWEVGASPGCSRATQQGLSRITTGGHVATHSVASSFVTGEALFLSSLPVIDDVAGQVCRRHCLDSAETADFRSDVHLHFIERDYEVLRRFEGRCTLRTFVTVVIQRLFLDYRNRLWGKWRPSAEAKRLGPTAVLLERLVSRDGWSIEQAAEVLRVNHGVEMDDALSAFGQRILQRLPPAQLVAESEANAAMSSSLPPDVGVLRDEQDSLAKRVRTALDNARQGLTPEERLILQMRFEDAVPVADIARALHLNQKRLYRTLERLLGDLCKSLEAEGVSRDDVRALFLDGGLGVAESEGTPRADEGQTPTRKPAERARTPWLQKR
jgi:RNA polymerase sigma factor (sigma-70 family)